jgi:hypothetical protein
VLSESHYSVGLLRRFRLRSRASHLFVLLRFSDLGAHFRSFSFRGYSRDQDIHHSGAGHLQVDLARLESFEGQEAGAGVAGPGVEVAAGGCHRAMAKGGLDEVDGRATVEGVGCVGMTQPVGADVGGNTRSFSSLAYDHADAPPVQPHSAPGGENRLLRARGVAPARQLRPKLCGQGDRPGAAILPEYRNLAGLASSV